MGYFLKGKERSARRRKEWKLAERKFLKGTVKGAIFRASAPAG
jgi:hypothetical protein